MKVIKNFYLSVVLRLGTLIELFQYLWNHKLWWSIPLIAFILLLTFILIFGQTTGVGPFIYPLF